MTTKSNSNTKQDQVLQTLKTFGLDKLKGIVLKSEKERREYGFRFCKNDGIVPTNICKGKKCYVELKYCSGENRPIGSFHTHPTTIKGRASFLSDEDIYTEASDKSEFACLGIIENNAPKIKCYLSNYGMEKSIIDNANNYRDKYNIKSKEYNPGGISRDIFKLPPEKQKELRDIYWTYLLADKRLKVEAARAALRLIKQPNEGADLIINL